ncbi:Zn-dependent protease [Herbihabitans rhizosphaerae]|uniref:Zn-dependent protease n=1 Tax=Herbihabitans rhizosphaerae TaxID=1872711 RepID=A0A4Q7KFD2_9PSEU|nr:Zn-dependent protease [Herbihabitans rhizosphaerae]
MRPSPIFLGLIALTVAGGVLTGLDNEYQSAGTIAGTWLLVIGGWAVSLCLHEFGHAFTAFRGGDREVYFKGYLTLDPRKYTDPVLSLFLPLLLLAAGGIPLPGGAVWINHYSLRSKGVESAVSLAGPAANLGLGILITIAMALTNPAPMLAAALSYLALVQILAFVLNMLPIPGLDGWGALEPYLSHRARELGAKARPWAPLVLFAVLIGIPGASGVLFDVAGWVFEGIGGEPWWIVGYSNFMFWR